MTDAEKTQDIQEERVSSVTQPPTELRKELVIDTTHGDEALKVLATYAGPQTWDKEEEKKVRQKIDRKLLAILCLTYALQYYDKGETLLRDLSRFV